MKNKINLLLLVVCLSFSQGLLSQVKMIKAKNCNALYNTNPNTPFTWNGAIKNGYCHGYGTIKWFNKKGIYEGKMIGTIKRGKNEGFCTLYDEKGRKLFEGTFKDDMKNGAGKAYRKDGTFVDGTWSNDELVAIDGEEVVEVDTTGVASSEDYGTTLNDEDIKNLQDHLEVFCYNNYEDCFSGREYIEYSLKVTQAELTENGEFKVEGTHSYKGSYGTVYYDMPFNALLNFDANKIIFNKRAKADYFHSSDYWEECTKAL